MAQRDRQRRELDLVVYIGYILCDRFLSASVSVFPDDDRYHADPSEHLELGHAGGIQFRNRCAYYADCMVSKLQRGKYRQPYEQDGSLREMVPTYMRGVVPHFGRISRYPLLY